MRHIYFEKKEIPRLPGSHIDKSRGNVFIFLPKPGERLTNKTKRLVIGRATSDTMMHPNSNYREMFPNLWKKYYGENLKLKEYQLNAGMYELVLGIGYKSNLYPLLIEAYGPLYANAIMDLALYSNISKSDSMMLFQDRMKDEIVFSKDRFEDSWISDFLRNNMTYNQNMRFMDLWLDNFKQQGETDVWLSIDGTNNDCNVEDCSKAEKTKAKSRRTNTDAISYMYVISAKTGLPIYMIVVNGGMVDAKTLKNVTVHLSNHNLIVKGVILDRAFCTIDVVSELDHFKYPYVLMLKSNNNAHTKMYEQYADTIRWNLDYFVENVNGTLFGCTSQNAEKIFEDAENKAFINLFFDGSNSAERISTLNSKIISTKNKIIEMIKNAEDIAIPISMTRYIGLKKEGDTIVPYYKKDNWGKDMAAKGFYSIATSENFGASLTNQYYNLRDCSEVMYSESKSQLGFNVLRSHSENGVENKLFIGFIATIIRSYIMQACKELKLTTNKMVIEMDRIHIRLNNATDTYNPIHDESQRQTALLKYFSVDISDLDSIASEYNSRDNAITSQVRKLKSFEDSKEKAEKLAKEQGKQEEKEKTRKKAGRPYGSKNKSTLEREAKIASGEIKPKEKGKPGRPKGSLNKKTLIKLAKNKSKRSVESKNKNDLERKKQAKKQKGNIKSTETQIDVNNQVQPKKMVEGKSSEILSHDDQIAKQPKNVDKNIQTPIDVNTQLQTKDLVEGKNDEITNWNDHNAESPKNGDNNIKAPKKNMNKSKGGRPYGSKDKQKSQKRNGRTYGSRNKTKIAEDQLLEQLSKNYNKPKAPGS